MYYCTSGIYKAVKGKKIGVVDKKNKVLVPFVYNSIIIDDYRINSTEKMYIYALEDEIWKKIDFSGQIVNSNCNNCDFIKSLAPYQINHYGFEYVRGLMISKEDLNKKIE